MSCKIIRIIIFSIIITYFFTGVINSTPANIYGTGESIITKSKIDTVDVNPAVLPYIENVQISAQFSKPYLGLTTGGFNNVNFGVSLPYIPLENGRTIGLLLNALMVSIGIDSPYFISYEGKISYGYKIYSVFSLGVGIKIKGWRLGNYNEGNDIAVSAYTYDLNLSSIFEVNEDTKIGFIANNILGMRNDSGVNSSSEGISRNERSFEIGITHIILDDNLAIGGKMKILENENNVFSFGFEKSFLKDNFNLRGGVIFGNNVVVTGGIGLKLNKFEINYAVSYSMVLHYYGSHYMSLNFYLN